MYYVRGKYAADNSTAIKAYNSYGECEFTATICLKDYGLTPTDEFHVYIPTYKLNEECLNKLMSDIIQEIEKKVYVGYNNSCECWYVRIKEVLSESEDIGHTISVYPF